MKKKEKLNVTTALYLSKEMLHLLQDVAHGRRRQNGGRQSVSRVITQILEGHEERLRKELEENGRD